MRNVFRLATFIGAMAIVGCAGAGMKPYTPVEQKTKLRDDQLFGGAERAVERHGYKPRNINRDAMTLETAPKEVDYSNHPRLYYRYHFEIAAEKGVLRINATCEKNSTMSRDELSDCGDERPKRVIEEQEQLYRSILEVAAKLP